MAINYQVWDFPTIKIRSQLFYAPGAAFDGGFTSGGARISSPEPGGRAYLEVEPSLQTTEWDIPFASWLMSKTNADIFRVQLVKTPQIVSNAALNVTLPEIDVGIPWAMEGQYIQNSWDNNKNWSFDDLFVTANAMGLEGETTLIIDVSLFGPVINYGHVIGHDNWSYLVEDINYDENIATIKIKPPLRKNVAQGDFIYLRPYFTGSIMNASEIRAGYEAVNNGHIKMPNIIFSEVVI